MRIRVIQRPPIPSIDGVRLDRLEPGCQYEVGNSLGALLLAERWAEPVPLDDPAALSQLREIEQFLDPFADRPAADAGDPPNLKRETYPPYVDKLGAAVAADFETGRRARPRRRILR
jgi:hypothetical protein